MMSNQTIIVRKLKKRFALGMSWRHENKKPNLSYIRESAANASSDSFLLRKSQSQSWQIGFCDLTTKGGPVYSLASVIASELPMESLSVVYRLGGSDGSDNGGQCWYLAIRDGEVLPDGDFVGGYYDCLAIRSQHSELGAWDIVGEEDISVALGRVGARKGLSSHTIKSTADKSAKSLVVLAMVAFVGIGGYYGWKKHKSDQAQKVIAAMQIKMRADARKKEIEAQIPPWTKKPDLKAFVLGCGTMLSGYSEYTMGWRQIKWTCSVDEENHVVSKREFENDGGLTMDAPGELIFGNEKHSVETTHNKVQIPPGNVSPRTLLDQNTAWRLLSSLAESMSSQLKTEGPAPEQSALPGVRLSQEKTDKTGQWESFPFTWKSAYSPFVGGFSESLRNISVTVLDSVSLEQGKWTLSGTVYYRKVP